MIGIQSKGGANTERKSATSVEKQVTLELLQRQTRPKRILWTGRHEIHAPKSVPLKVIWSVCTIERDECAYVVIDPDGPNVVATFQDSVFFVFVFLVVIPIFQPFKD